MSVKVHSHWVLLSSDGGENIAECSDLLMGALLDQEECNPDFQDAAVAVDEGTGVIEIEATAAGADLSMAIAVGQAAVQSALHQVGIGTPSWPDHDTVMRMVVKDMRHEQMA